MFHFSLSGLIFNSWCVHFTSFSLNMCQAHDYSFWDERKIYLKNAHAQTFSLIFYSKLCFGVCVFAIICSCRAKNIPISSAFCQSVCYSLPCLSPVSDFFFLFIFIFLLYLVLDFLIRGLYFLLRSLCLLRSVRISTNGETNQKGIQILIVCQ